VETIDERRYNERRLVRRQEVADLQATLRRDLERYLRTSPPTQEMRRLIAYLTEGIR
jgi:hypothetical protein